MFDAITRAAERRRWTVVGAFLALFLVAVAVGGPLTGGLSVGGFEDPDSEAVRAERQIEQASGVSASPSLIALVRTDGPAANGAGRARVEAVAAEIARDPDVARVVTPYAPGVRGLISRDGRAAYVVASLRDISDDEGADAAGRIEDALAGEPHVALGGIAIANRQIGSTISSDLARAEAIAFPLVLLLSLWVFRGVVAALLPALMGAVVIFAGFLGLGLLSQVTTISIFALNMVIGLSLGLAIDYSLLIVSRYREELGRTGPGLEAMRRTLQTAGRSVLYSAVTVGAALAGLMVFPQRFLFSMGIGGVMVAAFAALVALVLLPAVLALLGPRVNALAPRSWRRRSEEAHRPVTSGGWYRLSRFVMRRPAPVAAAAALVLMLVALPAFGVRFTGVDARVLPEEASARVVSDALAREFPPTATEPLVVAVTAPPSDAEAVAAYARRLGALPGAAAALPPVPVADGLWRVDVIPGAAPLDAGSERLLEEVRAVPAPGEGALVGGLTAGFVDQKTSLADHLPLAVALIALATVIALFLMTGSVVLPVKAVLMNLLTLGATVGVLVWVFQDGRLEGLLDFQSTGGLDLTQPILLGALAFGLSTDYAVFLFSRIKEAHDAGMDNGEAVAAGIQRTGRIVTAAALLFAIAIGAFAASDIVLIKQLGVGTALAVLIDATIIRAFLVPSLMALLGRWNWWAPPALRRFHRRWGVSEAGPEAA